MITTLEQAEEIIASGKADIVAMAKSFMADGDIVRKSLRAQQAETVRVPGAIFAAMPIHGEPI